MPILIFISAKKFARNHKQQTTEQKRECPHGTKATSDRGAMRMTSHTSRCGVAVAAAAVTAAVALADGVESTSSSSSSLLSSDVNWNASV